MSNQYTSPSVHCICEYCGAPFRAKPSHIARGAGRFCSRTCANLGKRNTITAAFWAKIDKDGPVPAHCPELGPCWLWMGGTANGYGQTKYNAENWHTHRLSWVIHFGQIADGLYVCHHCDVKRCVNPAHFFLGTSQENTADRHEKGRSAHGERAARSKLHDADVRAIMKRVEAGETYAGIADDYHVTPGTIMHICTGRTWRHITGLTHPSS